MTDISGGLRGVTSPVVTPFDGESVDWQAYDTLLSHVVDADVDAVFPCGTTGEFASLTGIERRKVVERTVQRTPAEVAVLAGGTGTNVDESIDWITTLAELGVDAVVSTAPYFHTSNDPHGVQQFFESIAERSPLPVVLYNIPACVGESVSVGTVEALSAHDSIVGLKDSSGDLAYGLRAQGRVADDFLLLQGYDPLLLPALRMGFDGGVNALSNVIPSAYVELLDDPATDRALELHREAIEPLFDLCKEEGFAPATKAALAERGVLPSNEVRPPLVSVDTDAVREAVDRAESVLA